jgi:hypothetical protein
MEPKVIEPKEKIKDPYELLLTKYISVWIWSILFGAMTGLTYTFLSSRIGNWGSLALLPGIPMVIGIIAIIQAWISIYRYLIHYLIPTFIHQSRSKLDNAFSLQDKAQPASWLRQAFLLMIIAVSMRLIMELIFIIFGSL